MENNKIKNKVGRPEVPEGEKKHARSVVLNDKQVYKLVETYGSLTKAILTLIN
jgi:hypothetical protein